MRTTKDTRSRSAERTNHLSLPNVDVRTATFIKLPIKKISLQERFLAEGIYLERFWYVAVAVTSAYCTYSTSCRSEAPQCSIE